MDCARRGGTAPAVLSAANEEAVALFLHEKLGFNQIYDTVAAAVAALARDGDVTLESLRAADAAARRHVKEHVG